MTQTVSLTFKQRTTWLAHLFKALAYQYHKPFAPMIRSLVPEDAVIIDVGGHAGQFTKLLSRIAPSGRVYVFEPGSYALSILRKVVSAHRLNNVTVVPCGLSDCTKVAQLNVPIKKSGSLGFGMSHIANAEEENVSSHEVALMALDDFAKDFLRLDAIKIDIEGWEVNALRGARNTIAKHRPVLMVEVVHSALERAGATPACVFKEFTSLDYVFFRTDEHQDYRVWPVQAHEGDGDYIFVPRERAGLLNPTLQLAA